MTSAVESPNAGPRIHLLSPEEAAVSVTTERLPAVRAQPVLPDLGVNVRPTGDGQVAVILPAGLARFFLADLEQRAQAWSEALRRADLEQRRRQAELRAVSEESRQHLEALEDDWLAEYDQLRAKGKGYRETLRLIQGADVEADVAPGIGMIEDGIRLARARRKAQARATRDAEIRRLAEAGLTRQEIADQLGLDYPTVRNIVNRQNIPCQVKRSIRSKVPVEWCEQEKSRGEKSRGS